MATRFPVTSVASDLASFRRAFDPFFADVFAPARQVRTANVSARSILPLDVFATGDNIVVLAAIPGVDPEQIEISIEKNVLTLRGSIANAAESAEAKDSTWYLHELPSGSFQRSLTLPVDVDASRAEATFEHGMLRLTLPKQEAAKPRQIRVKVAGASSAEPTEAPAATPIAESATATETQAD